jgi:23S rRNA (cytidine1920-2'-O)/16S rRNA (cytidine1409-2'-O)-methyltransferase
MAAKTRLDVALVERGLAETRAAAQRLVMAGLVFSGEKKLEKAGLGVASDTALEVRGQPHPYVSRGALKLIAALDRFSLSPDGRVCLDLGASTGGFTQVLLERGAAHVHALDVGHDQMDAALKNDPRVTAQDGMNVRDLLGVALGQVEAITADLSFISLKLALPPALALATPGAWVVALVKPQFEAGRAAIGKGGIVRDRETREAVVAEIAAFVAEKGWRVLGHMESPIAGGDGNIEYLLAAVKP